MEMTDELRTAPLKMKPEAQHHCCSLLYVEKMCSFHITSRHRRLNPEG